MAGRGSGNETESTLTYEDETITYTSEKNNVKDIDLGQIIDDKVAQETTRVKAEEVRLAGLTGNEIKSTLTYEDETITYTFEKNNVKDIDLGQIITTKLPKKPQEQKLRKLDHY